MGIYIETDFYFFTAYIFFHSQRIILIMTHSLVTTTDTLLPLPNRRTPERTHNF